MSKSAASGAADTVEALYRAHASTVFRRARRLLGNDPDAQETVNDVFLSLQERPGQYSGRGAITHFLYGMTTHACLNRIRNRRNRERLLETDGADAMRERAMPAEPDRVALLRNLLERMPEPLGQVAVYYYMDELSHAEIAEILGCSRRQVGNLLDRLAHWVQRQESEA